MDNVSVIVPCETDRVPLLEKSIEAYEKFGIPEDFEFIIVSRTIKPNQLKFKHRLINYDWDLTPNIFNPSLAFNLGVKAAKHDNIVITCPEVKPFTDCFRQLKNLPRGNYVCTVWDLNEKEERVQPLVSKDYRTSHPGFYFLALYKKEDIETINGWDLNFMYGWAWDDNDFGERFARAHLPFEILNDVCAEHQYHKRAGDWNANWTPTKVAYLQNKARVDEHMIKSTIRINPGLKEVEEWYGERY